MYTCRCKKGAISAARIWHCLEVQALPPCCSFCHAHLIVVEALAFKSCWWHIGALFCIFLALALKSCWWWLDVASVVTV